MLIRYLPVILVLAALVLALAPLETAGQSASGPSASDAGPPQPEAARKADKPRPQTSGAPVDANAGKAPLPPGSDPRSVRPAQAFPPERIAPSNIEAVDPNPSSPAVKDDPRSVEERADPGG